MAALLSFIERPALFMACASLALPAYWMLGRFFYTTWADFLDALRLWFQPGWLSALRGEWHEDNWESLKLLAYFMLFIVIATGVYKGAKTLF